MIRHLYNLQHGHPSKSRAHLTPFLVITMILTISCAVLYTPVTSPITGNIRPSNPTSGCLSKENETLTWKDVRTPLFPAELFTRAEMWKRPRCPSIDEWMEKKRRTYTMDYRSAIKEWNLTICIHMDGPRGDCAQCNKLDRKRQRPYDFNYTWNIKHKTAPQTKQNKSRPMDTENTLVVARGDCTASSYRPDRVGG